MEIASDHVMGERMGLLYPNNMDDYIGSGGRGYTNLLPQSDFVPGMNGRLKDMWVLSESQETVGVSPEVLKNLSLDISFL